MRYIDTTQPGSAEVLTLAETATPTVKSGEVLIRVMAAGINRADILQRRGFYPPPLGASPILGLEVAGIIEAIAPDVTEFTLGDKVCALLTGGGYAEYTTAPAALCLPVPAACNWIQAAALPEACFTVWHNVFQRGRLIPGETLLIHGGSSGIGTTAIQIARALQARVIVTCGNAQKSQACENLGAEKAINYHEEDFVSRVQEITAGWGVDVILDMVGGDYVEKNLQVAAINGRIVNIAFSQGAKITANVGAMISKRLSWLGSNLRGQTVAEKAHIATEVKQFIWPLIESQQVRPIIHQVFPFHDVQQAHRMMESSQHIGKLVLDLGSIK